jgi:hypothetical protein
VNFSPVHRRRLLWLVAAIAAVALALWWPSRLRPTWWRPAPVTVQSRAVAGQLEQGVVAEVQRVRTSPDPWGMQLEEEQINNWLAARLRPWVEHHDPEAWPEPLSAVRVRCLDGAIEVGAEYDGRVYSIRATPHSTGEGVRVELGRLWVGRLPTPAADGARALLEQLDPAALEALRSRPDLAPWIEALLDSQPITPELPLVDGRTVRLLDVKVVPGRVLIRCATSPADDEP